MGRLAGVIFFLGLLILVLSEFPIDDNDIGLIERNVALDETVYRLPEDLDPIHCVVEITPYFTEAPSPDRQFSFDGKVTHFFKAAKPNLNSFILQENVRDVIDVILRDENRNIIPLHPEVPRERIQAYHFLKINLPAGVTLNYGSTYELYIEYIGNINETPLSRGVFRGNYKDNAGNIHWYAATHLQPVNSRQAFPCFDEPGFKSTFDIIINRPANFAETFANMPLKSSDPIGNNRVREVFHRTPKMSAYLVSFHISEDFTVIADNNNATRSYRIIARPGTEGQGSYALEIGPPLNDWLEEYLGVEYYTMEANMKNDQLASPYWASGATENWGLVTYRELRLLYQEGETNAADKMSIGTITAHELAHKWFGNYITARWWDNVWINEGFASYFEYFAMDEVDKSMELADQFVIMYIHSALSADASTGTRALQHTVNSPSQVTGHFSGISYSKGAAFLLMLKHLVSEPLFKNALTYFLKDREYDHAFPEDLYRAFAVTLQNTTLPNIIDIADFMKYWVDEPGYPVINVNVNMESGLIKIEQERFFISATAQQTNQIWPIPLTYTSGNNPNWDDVTPKHVMTGKQFVIQKEPGHEWVIFNVKEQGIYRVNYDRHNWEMLASALNNNHSNIHHLNRAQIVDDVFALMRSERMPYELGFQVLEFLKKDTSYFSWYPAITGFNWLRNRFLHIPDVLADFDALLYEFLENVIDALGYEYIDGESLTTTLNRFYVLSFACNIGHSHCVQDAVAKFTAMTGRGERVNPNIRRHVFCQGLREGGYNEWKYLKDRRDDSNNQADETAMLRSLGCTSNDQAKKEFLEMILDDNYVKAQDRVNAFSFLMMGDRNNAHAVLDFLKERTDDIRRAVVLPAWFNNVLSNVASYLDEEGLTDMDNWLEENQATLPEYSVGKSSISSARANIEWGTQRARDILRAARGSATVIYPTVLTCLSALFVMLLK